ncbi:26S proteasome regulatory subunit 7 [Glycine soja]
MEQLWVDRNKYQIQIPLPPKIDPSVTMMTVEEKPDVTYNDVGGCKEQIEKMREVVELPMLHPEKFVKLGIDPPKGVLCYSPPGTGKTLLARAVANRTDACFIRVIGSELVQKYVGEDARMVRELFQMAHSKTACIVFFDEVDAIGGARFDDGVGGDNEVQHTMLEIVNSTGADIRSVCTEAGMYAIRARRKTVTEKDFLDAVNKVIKGYQKFSATPNYSSTSQKLCGRERAGGEAAQPLPERGHESRSHSGVQEETVLREQAGGEEAQVPRSCQA